MDYDTEIKNLRNSMLELKIKIMMLSSKKDISDFAEQVKNYTKEYNELKRNMQCLHLNKGKKRKKEDKMINITKILKMKESVILEI